MSDPYDAAVPYVEITGTKSNSNHNSHQPTKRSNPSFTTRGKARGGKRKATHRGNDSSESKRPKQVQPGEVSHPSSIARPILRHFPVWTANSGALTVCNVVYDSIRGRDNRMAQFITLAQLQYVTILSYWFRVADIGLQLGYALETHELSNLKRVVRSIYLPSLCRRFIDSIGEFKLPSGAVIVPRVCSLDNAVDYIDVLTPQDILHMAGRPLPDNYWGIDYEWVMQWNQNTTRASRDALGFTQISDTLDGRAEFSCSYRIGQMQAGFIEPLAPFAIPKNELELGASFRYRSNDTREDWIGEYNYLLDPTHTGEEFDYAQLLSERVVSSVVDRRI